MSISTEPVQIADVDRLILVGARTLCFPQATESLFERQTVDARRRHVIFNNAIGLAAYEAFLVSDHFIVGDVFGLSLFVHLCVMLPTMGLVNLVVARTRRAWLRETVLAAGIVLTTSAILLLTLLSRAPHRDYEQFSIVLAILFATIVQKIRFWYVAAACLTSLLLTATANAVVYADGFDRMLFADATFACVVMFALIGSYHLEREQRLGFLLRLRDELRTAELKTASLLDPLTRVGNRRALDEALAAIAAVETPVAVLLVDIDHFKEFNDCNGHQAGDVCLENVARIISTTIRRSDGVFRFGGEEFLVLMPGAQPDDARHVAERIRGALASASIPTGQADAAFVTVSVGAASSASEPVVPSDLIAGADRALYEAKRDGRNRVRLANANRDTVVIPFKRMDHR